MKFLYLLTILFAKSLTVILKLTKKGRGTALPGLIVQKYIPILIPYILNKSPYTILITGTNGKTTTRTFLCNVLESKYKVLQNRSGSNLLRGIISEIISQSDYFGNVKHKFAVFEVEEASMPNIAKFIKAEQIIITNLYRDQLDAYGEVDRTQKFIQEAVDLSPESFIILNGDDPRVSQIKVQNDRVIYFGINDPLIKMFDYEGNIDIKNGITKRTASRLEIKKNLGTSFTFDGETYEVNIPGYFNVYNALASILSAGILNIDTDNIKNAISMTKPAFGRGEIIEINDKQLHLFLVKNPAGFNLNLDLIKSIKDINLALVLNDNIADGKDVSWIWDSNLEILNQMKARQIICSGTRSEDMLLRVKYAIDKDNNSEITEIKPLSELTMHILNSNVKHFYILLTYTAMLELRKLILGNSLNV